MVTALVQGVGGAVHLPKGYLQKVYEQVRARGGLCISDEVQTGFGRLGSHYWGFETHGVVPDIGNASSSVMYMYSTFVSMSGELIHWFIIMRTLAVYSVHPSCR